MPILGTQSLAQLVQVRPEVSGSVDPRKAFHHPREGARLLSRFSPLSPQVQALRAAAEAVADGGALLLTGAPGTGKSMLAYLLGRALSVDFPGGEFTELCERVGNAGAARALSAARTPRRRWLVVLAQPEERADFDTALRQALNGALHSHGVDFAPPAGKLLREDFQATAQFLKSRRGYQGVAVFVDPVDRWLEPLLENPDSREAGQLRDFVGFCRESDYPLFFCGVADREIGLITAEQETALFEVFPRIQPVTLLGQREEWENLVARTILSHPDGDIWDDLLHHPDMKMLRESLSRNGLYRGSSDRWQKETVIEGCYPLHPVALFALPRLALRLANAGRTAFTFFSDSSPGGLLYFLNNFAVAQPNGRLSLYTAESLFTYFEKCLQENPHNADYLETLKKSQMKAGDVPQARRLLRLVAVFQMVAHERLRSREEELLWALHLGEREIRIARRSLQLLAQKGALHFDEASGEYRLPLEQDRITLEEALPRVRSRLRAERDVVAVLQRLLRPPRLAASRFNHRFHTDRHAFSGFFQAGDVLAQPDRLLSRAQELIDRPRPYRGDLLLACILAESDSQVKALRQSCQTTLQHPRLVVALPLQPRSFEAEALEVIALERLRSAGPPFSDPTSSEREKLEQALTGARAALEEGAREFLAPENLEFHHQGRAVRDLDREALGDYLDERLAEVLGNPPVVEERALTCMTERNRYRSRRQLALNYLLGCRGSLALRADDTPESSILRAGLVDSGILKPIRRQGIWEYFDLAEEIPDQGLGQAFQVLRTELVGDGTGRRTTDPLEVLRKLRAPPHSLTPAMAELLLAALFWRWRHELHLYKNQRRARAESRPELREAVKVSAEALYELVADAGDWSVEFMEASEEEARFLAGLIRIFQPDFQPTAGVSLWQGAARRLEEWFQGLPPAARTLGAGSVTHAEALIPVLTHFRGNPRELLAECIPQALGAPPAFSWAAEGQKLLAALTSFKENLENLVPGLEERLEEGLGKIFPDGEGDWAARARSWFDSLPKSTRPARRRGDAALLEAAIRDDHPRQKLLSGMGYPEISSWRHDYSPDVLERVERVKAELTWHAFRKAYPVDRQQPEATALRLFTPAVAGVNRELLEAVLVEELERVAWAGEEPPAPWEPPPVPEERPAAVPDTEVREEPAAAVPPAREEKSKEPPPERKGRKPAEEEGGEAEDLTLEWL